MLNKAKITLPSSFIAILDELDENVSVAEIEEKIIADAVDMFDAQWGSIKYYYGNQFVSGFSSVPQKYRLKPRKRGFMFKTVENNKPYLMTEEILRKAHPEAAPQLKSILIAPLRMDETTIATVSLVNTNDRSLSEDDIASLNNFGTIYGRALKMAHTFAAEKKAAVNRNKFMSFAAHEIKNPLMAFSSYTQLIQRNLEKNKEINGEWLQKMNDEVSRMKSLIGELLDIRQSQDGELSYTKEKISFEKLMTQVVENFKIRNPHRKVSIVSKVPDSEIHIMGDEIKLTQVFINLLNNAHKFSEIDEPITLKTSVTGDYLEIIVEDKGVGIAAEDVPYIFNEFYRGNNSEQKKGIGVGLFLVKNIIYSHNGTINLESVLGKGTTFTVRLPTTI